MFILVDLGHPAAGKASRGGAMFIEPRPRRLPGIAVPTRSSWSGASR